MTKQDDSGELIQMPNGDAVFYVDDSHPSPNLRHSYWRANEKKVKGVVGWARGTRLTGVTTAVKPLDFDPERLLKWAARTQCIGIAELFQLNDAELAWLASQESIWTELEQHELTFEHVRDRAGTRGRNVHELAFRALAMGRPVPELKKMTKEEKGYAGAVIAFWDDHDPDALGAEEIVYSSKLGVAGRLDFRGRLGRRCGRGGCACAAIANLKDVGVIDAKTGGFIGKKDHAQVAGYRELAEEDGHGSSKWGAILKLYEDGSYDLLPCRATAKDFRVAVDAYRRAARIDREAEKDRKAAEVGRETEQELEEAVAA